MEWMAPHPITMPLHTVQVLGRKRPFLRREMIGKTGSTAAARKSTRIESWVNAAMQQMEDQGGELWLPMVDALFNHGECAVLCYPSPAHWEKFPDFTEGEDDEIAERFQRDAKGRDRDDEYYQESSRRSFRASAKTSRAAYEDYASDFKARNLPLVARMVTAEECLPVLGPGYRLDGLLVLSHYTVDALKRRGYQWAGGDGHPNQGQGEATSTQGNRVALLEYWRPGKVSYYVTSPSASGGALIGSDAEVHRKNPIPMIGEGKAYETWKVGSRKGDESAAEIDLAKEYGIDRLLASYIYGPHFAAERDPDFRGVPFLWPFVKSLHAINNVMTAKAMHAWKYGFGGWFIEYTPGSPVELAIENGKPRTLQLDPMTAVYVAGRPTPTVHDGTGPDVDELVTLSFGVIREEGVSQTAFGGAGASSGHERSVIRAHLEEAQAHVLEGARKGWEEIGEMALESATAIARKQDMPVPVYASVLGQKQTGMSRDLVEITRDTCDSVYELVAYYRRRQGENLPYAQMTYEWWRGGGIPERMFLEEGVGTEDPEDLIVEKAAEDLLFKTEIGKMQLYEEAARQMGDEKQAEMLKLQREGLMYPDGTPQAAGRDVGMQRGGPPDQPATGTGLPNEIASAVGGIVAGGLGTQSINRDMAATDVSRP